MMIMMMMMMDLKPFKLDIDELINEFAQGGSTKLAEMKAIWRSRKFSFIFEAIPCPSTNQACFIESLFARSIGYMVSKNSLSYRLGGLYCLYCCLRLNHSSLLSRSIYLSLN